ncbi:unnamed protein product [Hanseniaspora opuntiae]
MIKPLKKKQKVMNFNLFDDNKDEKSTSFINLVDDHVNVNTPHIIDLSDDNVDTKASKDTEKSTGDNKDDSYDNVILPAGAKELENVLHEKEEAVVSSDKSPSNTTNLSQKEDVSPITLNNQSNDLSDVESEKKEASSSESSVDFIDVESEKEEKQENLSQSSDDIVDVENVNEKPQYDSIDYSANDAADNNQDDNKTVEDSVKSQIKDTHSIDDHHELKKEKSTGIFDLEEEDDDQELGITKDFVDTKLEKVDDSDDDFSGKDLVQQMDKEEEDYRDLVHSKDESQLNQVFVEDGNTAVTDSTPHNDILGYSQLISRYRKLQRDAEEVTPQMVEEVQELLQHFGIPYLTAPMEAEAQCAELMRLELVDGIITDDSDVFLFGGSKIYRKMFQEKQFVEFYDLEAIHGTLGLSRDFLIDLAFLLGSDYTLGIKGIGPVAAVEILANFGSLEKFKEWYNDGMHNSEKIADEKGFEKALRKKLTSNNIILSEKWPYADVIKEYKSPTVDKDETPFKWGKPDLDRLRTLMRNYLSWTDEKTDEVLIPLIKEMNSKSKKTKQRKLTDFFPVDYSLHSYESLSSRLKKAVEKLKEMKA